MNNKQSNALVSNLMTVKEVSAYLRMPRPTVYYLMKRGSIPSVKIGGRWRIPRDRLAAGIGNNEVQAVETSELEIKKKQFIEAIASEVINTLLAKAHSIDSLMGFLSKLS
jgi:excisionase family DNA binding protein